MSNNIRTFFNHFFGPTYSNQKVSRSDILKKNTFYALFCNNSNSEKKKNIDMETKLKNNNEAMPNTIWKNYQTMSVLCL